MCYNRAMSYRTIEIRWLPRSTTAWKAFTSSRKEAARLWGDLVERHFRIRRMGFKWPTKARWQKWAKRRYPGLHSQSVQQIIAEFCEAVESARQLREKGHSEAKYPWRKPKYRDVIYTNQAARIRNGQLILPNGKSGDIRIKLPTDIVLPGRLMKVRLGYGRVLIVCEVPEERIASNTTIGIDLGVNTLISATDGQKALLVSGREVKATVQWRNKRLASIQAKQSKMQKGSRRWRKLQRRKAKMLAKAQNRIKDILHKATRLIANAFPGATCYVGKPFNDAATKLRATQAQQVSQACNLKIVQLLNYKLAGAIMVDEEYSSQTCPVCGERSKHRRVFRCKCGVAAPRDVIGAVNILAIGQHGSLAPGRSVPNAIEFVRPIQVSRRKLSSSGGHPASSSLRREAAGF